LVTSTATASPDFAVASFNSNTVSVRLNTTVTNQAPTAAADAYSTAEDTILTVPTPGVLANDSDPDGNTLSAVLGSGPSHGTLTLNPDGSFTYTPAANFNGSDTFTYRAGDGTVASSPATVAITVTATDDTPTATDDAYTTPEDTALTVAAPGVLGNDRDADGDTLSAELGSGPSHGAITLNADGSFTYTPDANYNGNDSFTYRAGDGGLESDLATVTIAVNAVNDAPTAAADAYTTDEDTALTVAAPGVLANDSDPDGDTLSAAVGSGPTHGTLTLNPNGSFTYTPTANYNGPDSFTYRASDGTLTSNLATVTLTVSAVNDTPTVTVATGGTCGTDDHSGTINLTVADVETAVAALTLSASSNSTLVPNGNVVFGGSGTTRTMTVSTVDGRSGIAILTVTVSDGRDSGTVEVTVRVGGGGKDTLTGGTGADLLLAQSNTDTLTGEDGNDLLCGDSGGDTLSGGGGDDSLGGGSGTDRLTGGPGADRFSGGSAPTRRPTTPPTEATPATARSPRSGVATDRQAPATAATGVALGPDVRIGSPVVSPYQAGCVRSVVGSTASPRGPGGGSMPPEQEDARARQIEALRRYVAQLGIQRDAPPGPACSRIVPIRARGSGAGAHTLAAAAAAHRAAGRLGVARRCRHRRGRVVQRPAGRHRRGRRVVVCDPEPQHHRRRPGRHAGVQDGGGPRQRAACHRRQAAAGTGRVQQVHA
jgi:VCBS repeat-containing protein